jgi:hypothetical protein
MKDNEQILKQMMKQDLELFGRYHTLLNFEVSDLRDEIEEATSFEDLRLLRNIVQSKENMLLKMVSEITKLLEESNFYFGRKEFLDKYTRFNDVAWALSEWIRKFAEWNELLEKKVVEMKEGYPNGIANKRLK